jgi:hypothetical protein
MKTFFYKLNKFFEIHIGPFFVNGYKARRLQLKGCLKNMVKKKNPNEL